MADDLPNAHMPNYLRLELISHLESRRQRLTITSTEMRTSIQDLFINVGRSHCLGAGYLCVVLPNHTTLEIQQYTNKDPRLDTAAEICA